MNSVNASAAGFAVSVNTGRSGAKDAKKGNGASVDFMQLVNENMGAAGTQGGPSAKTADVSNNAAFSFESRTDTNNMQSRDAAAIGPRDRDALSRAADTVSDGIEEKISEETGVSDEDLENVMETLGLSFIDLLNPENLADAAEGLSEELNIEVMPEDVLGSLSDSFVSLNEDVLSQMQLEPEVFNAVMEDVRSGDPGFLAEMELMETPETLENPNLLAQLNGMGLEDTDPGENIRLFDKGFPAEDAAVKIINVIDEPEPVQPVVEDVLSDEDGDAFAEVGAPAENEQTSADTGSEANAGSDGHLSGAKEKTPADVHYDNAAAAPVVNQNFAQTVSNVQAAAQVESYTSIDVNDIMEQIVTSAQTQITEDSSSMEMLLNPQNLGRMLMQVQEQNGVITARLVAESESVKNALEGQLQILQDQLNERGTKVQAVEVTVATHEFEQNLEEGQNTGTFDGQQQEEERRGPQGSRMQNLHRDELAGLSGLMSEEEQLAARIMRDEGNTLNYTA